MRCFPSLHCVQLHSVACNIATVLVAVFMSLEGVVVEG